MAFKMKGHTLPGINQRSETKNMADGRSKSSAFQKNGDNKRVQEIRKKIKDGVGPDGFDMSDAEHQKLVMELKKMMKQESEKKSAKSPAKKLKGKQHKIDMNKDGKISKEDFNMMNSSPAKMYGKKSPAKNYKKGYYKK